MNNMLKTGSRNRCRAMLSAALMIFAWSTAASADTPVVPPEGGLKKLLKITGYYSPLPDQSRYVRGSYEADIRLNGRGTNGADGTEVYPGMLAAPRTYPFGTQIFIPGLGLGTVHDRGGAIVPAGMRGQSHDRVDVWMGRGEAGLSRALQWGVRLVEAIVYPNGSGSVDDFSFLGVAQADLSGLPMAFMSSAVRKDAHNRAIRDLQTKLQEMGFYRGVVTGHYDAKTEQAVLDFQLAFQVVPSPEAAGAGVFGPRTKQTFLAAVKRFEQKKIDQIAHLSQLLPSGLSEGSKGKVVKHVQEVLADLGYYTGKVHGEYDTPTTEAVLRFQLDHGIIGSKAAHGAGVFGPKTKAVLFRLFAERESTLAGENNAGLMATAEFTAAALPVTEVDLEGPSVPERNTPPAPSVYSKSFPDGNADPGPTAVASGQPERAMVSASFEAVD